MVDAIVNDYRLQVVRLFLTHPVRFVRDYFGSRR